MQCSKRTILGSCTTVFKTYYFRKLKYSVQNVLFWEVVLQCSKPTVIVKF